MTDNTQRLSKIQTIWDEVFAAHGKGDERQQALAQLASRYFQAIYNYIRGAIRNDHDAADVTSTFAVRLMEGKLAHQQSDGTGLTDPAAPPEFASSANGDGAD